MPTVIGCNETVPCAPETTIKVTYRMARNQYNSGCLQLLPVRLMSSLSPFAAPAAHGNKGKRAYWSGLPAGALPIAIGAAARRHPGLTLVVTKDANTAIELARGIRFFQDEEARQQLPLLRFPGWGTLPYESFSPHPEIISERVRVLHNLLHVKRGILITPAPLLLQRIAPKSWLQGNSLVLRVGAWFDLGKERKILQESGYIAVDTVHSHGEYAIRGALIDIFPAGSALPLRIELLDEQIDMLRTFDPETQRTIEKIESVEMLPAKEYPLTPDAVATFRENWYRHFAANPHSVGIYRDLERGASPAGIEYYLPLFFERTDSLLDYLPASVQVIVAQAPGAAVAGFYADTRRRYDNLGSNSERPVLAPEVLLFAVNETFSRLKGLPRIDVSSESLPPAPGNYHFAARMPPDVTLNSRAQDPLASFKKLLASHVGRTLLCTAGPGRRAVLQEVLGNAGIQPEQHADFTAFMSAKTPLGITTGDIEDSVLLEDPGILILTESALFGDRMDVSRQAGRQGRVDQIIRNLTELRIGAPVVHRQYGVGRFQGLKIMEFEDIRTECLQVAYAADATLYVPVAALDLISRYTGADEDLAPLDRLDGRRWKSARAKAAQQVQDVATELFSIQARRAATKGFRFRAPDQDYQCFVMQFPYAETLDQQRAITEVIADMTSPEAMDRLICGDVGFGKTEVAMRAAFLAVQSGKQVAILTPTTLLAQQHYNSFRDRFADWPPILIDMLSRFRSGKESERLIAELASGVIDIVIGTHALLRKGICFKNLGLTIVDEEHRFGVRHKEALKKLRLQTDVLTLTATPIPRTLDQALSDLRSMSLIATPPPQRVPIKTFVRELDWDLVQEAIQRELLRGGQVYYLHNDVATMAAAAERVTQLNADARIGIAHGQMPKNQLERVMASFYRQHINVLICTTIIESGIDVPNANTIIMERADLLGLAQLHQLRGRVGRSHHQAYAYLLTLNRKLLPKNAVLRLQAIEAAGDLGAGFMLATHDMEIRGAGNLLGKEQSGQIRSVGFSLYQELLQEAVAAIRSGRAPEFNTPFQQPGEVVNLHVSALLPADFVDNVHTRLILYHRLAEAPDIRTLQDLQAEIVDRFGPLAEEAETLFHVTSLKILAKKIGIRRIDVGPQGGLMVFARNTPVDPTKIVQLLQSNSGCSLGENGTLRIRKVFKEPRQRFDWVRETLTALGPKGQDGRCDAR